LILPTLREIAKEPVVLVGHSRGGCIAVVAASRHPELTHALVVTGAPLVRPTSSAQSPLAYRTLRSLARHHLVSARRLEAARHKYGSTDYRNAEGVMRDVLVASVNESYEDELTSLALPVTFVWGGDDHEVPVDVARRAAELTPGPTSLTVLDGVGHLVPLEAPGALEDAAEKALRQ
jgi:pimeloyl-ACP methyl ester carboxylesterase